MKWSHICFLKAFLGEGLNTHSAMSSSWWEDVRMYSRQLDTIFSFFHYIIDKTIRWLGDTNALYDELQLAGRRAHVFAALRDQMLIP
jgi:hypothetical protein